MRRKIAYLILVGCIFLCQTNAFAQIGVKRNRFFSSRFDLEPFLGGLGFGDDIGLKSDVILGARGAFNINHIVGFEGTFGFSPANVDTLSEPGVNIWLTQLNLIVNFSPPMHGSVVPFLTAGMSVHHFDVTGGSSVASEFGFNFGGGLKLFFNDFVALRADLNYTVLPGDSIIPTITGKSKGEATGIFLFSGGISFFFDRVFSGRERAAQEELIDDILAKRDRIVAIDSDLAAAEREREMVLTESHNSSVSPRSIDSDHDGVKDDFDRCPNTPLGIEVGSEGCPAIFNQASVVLDNVKFETNSAKVTQASTIVLNLIAKALLNNPNVKLEIKGFTDNSGSKTSNLSLSQKRADAVRLFLMSKGIEPDRLIARGYGEANPIANNRTAEGRDRNRRVELHRIY